MKVDKKIETEMGTVRFVGELSEDEVDYVITIGLATLMIRGELEAQDATADGTLIQEGTDTLQ